MTVEPTGHRRGTEKDIKADDPIAAMKDAAPGVTDMKTADSSHDDPPRTTMGTLHQAMAAAAASLAEMEAQSDRQSIEEALAPAPEPFTMRTLLHRFSEQFDASFRPLLDPIQSTAARLGQAGEDLPARRILPTLRDVAHQVQVLVDKVAQQQAYVLIFGPLKSGKSTFMNAMCSAYVSEVTCLPAYPCMVYVGDGETTHQVVSRYDGQTVTIDDADALHEMVGEAHRKLTQRIREVETAGEAFDPQRDLPEAIRRIDVRMRAGALRQSGAVLVDTPGLYSRMKFGYDRMTREFRNAAACAVFVVKTDNLFLEQVFDEFQELLELFSRIFLVVNLDAAKQDLQPDGTLRPSLEREDPTRIIEAFERLAMTTPLKQAADEGRLRIFPVDLLSAASRRIRSERGTADPMRGQTPRGQADFDNLLRELTDYLNSNEYLRAFLRDSLRRAHSLADETGELLQDASVQQLEQDVQRLRSDRDHEQRRITAIQRLLDINWDAKLHSLQSALQQHVQEHSQAMRDQVMDRCRNAVQQWFDCDASLARLVGGQLQQILAAPREELSDTCHEQLRLRALGDDAAIKLTDQIRVDLDLADMRLSDAARKALDAIDALAPKAGVPVPEEVVKTAQIPVRRRIWDWLLLRSMATVRRKVFGPPNQPDLAIAPAVKARRLGDAARQVLLDACATQFEQTASAAAQHIPQGFFVQYATALRQALMQAFNDRRQQVQKRLEDLTRRLQQAEAVQESIQQLQRSVDSVGHMLHDLDTEFGQSHDDLADLDAEAAVETEGAEDEAELALMDGAAETLTADEPTTLALAEEGDQVDGDDLTLAAEDEPEKA